MRKTLMLFGLSLLCTFVACSKQPSGESPVAEAEPAAGSKPESPALVPEPMSEVAEQPAEPEMDYGDWLRLPEGIDRRYGDIYPTLVKSAIAGDASGQLNLAMVSQQLAIMLARAGKNEEAYRFLTQAGRALRAGLPQAANPPPDATISNIFFNEACALSRSGKLKEAVAALNDAVEHGLTNLSAISTDEDLAAVRESNGFSEQFEIWQETIAAKVRAEAQHDLAAGETFPFELIGTSISGVDIDLAALQGKVVIVDIWGTWCPPCRAEIPSFIKLQEKFGEQGFQMIGLNYEQKKSDEANLAAVVDFAKEFGINYPCILGDKGTLTQVPGFGGYPTTLFIDKSGKVRMKAVGLHPYDYLEAVVSELLAEES